MASSTSTTVATPAQVAVRPEFQQELDRKYATLQANADKWRLKPLKEKIALLKELKAHVLDNMHAWGREGAVLKGQANDKWAIAESTFISPLVLQRYMGTLVDVFEALDATGAAPAPAAVRTTPSGQTVVQVFPATEKEKKDASLKDFKSEIYIQPGKPTSQGSVYVGDKEPSGGQVTAMLGAGNLGFLGVKDILYALFECNNVVLFKPHPIQADWHKFADLLLEPLSKAGVYASVYTNDVSETQAMLYHPAAQAVHMTGGTATHDAIVWGADPTEQARRKAANDPVLKVPMTSELGCVTPWIVTPGVWTEEQLTAQALDAANAVHFNNSCACNSLKVLVLPASWPQADAFLAKIKDTLKSLPLPPAWYPGHNQRYNAWKAQFPGAEALAGPVEPPSKDLGPNAQPMPFLINEVAYPEPDAELTPQQQYAFTVEPFAPVLTVVRVPAGSPDDYMRKATAFANDRLWGTLSCSVLLHPDMERDYPQASQQMLDDLRFGSVAVNAYSGIAYSTPNTMWGAYVGDQTLANVTSGIGYINNTLLLDYPQKAVVRLPFVSSSTPKPLSMMGLPSWAFGPLAGLLIGGVSGLVRAVFRK